MRSEWQGGYPRGTERHQERHTNGGPQSLRESGWCQDLASVQGAWGQAGVRFSLGGVCLSSFVSVSFFFILLFFFSCILFSVLLFHLSFIVFLFVLFFCSFFLFHFFMFFPFFMFLWVLYFFPFVFTTWL